MFRKLVQDQSLVQKKCYQQLLFLYFIQGEVVMGCGALLLSSTFPEVQYSPFAGTQLLAVALVKQIHEQARTAVHCQDFDPRSSRR